MENNFSLLRKEIFGGTLYNAISNKRLYINQQEFNEIKNTNAIFSALRLEVKAETDAVSIIEPNFLPLDNFSAPDTVYFEITRFCNLTCTHCFNDSGKRLSRELSSADIEVVLDDIACFGVQEIRFTGGEPLVVKDILNFIKIIRKKGLRASIGSNGTTITTLVAEQLAEAGLNSAIISIDGDEEYHDTLRGKNSFKRAVKGIENLLKAGIEVRVNTVVMKSNLHLLPVVAEYFSSRNIPLMIRRLILAGRADLMNKEMLSNEDYDRLRENLKPYLSSSKKLVKGHYLQKDVFVPRILLPFSRYGCSAGHRGLVILPTGDVQTCGFLGPLGEKARGNIKEEYIGDIWKRLTNSDHIQSLRELLPAYNNNSSNVCTNCLAIALAAKNNYVEISLPNLNKGDDS